MNWWIFTELSIVLFFSSQYAARSSHQMLCGVMCHQGRYVKLYFLWSYELIFYTKFLQQILSNTCSCKPTLVVFDVISSVIEHQNMYEAFCNQYFSCFQCVPFWPMQMSKNMQMVVKVKDKDLETMPFYITQAHTTLLPLQHDVSKPKWHDDLEMSLWPSNGMMTWPCNVMLTLKCHVILTLEMSCWPWNVMLILSCHVDLAMSHWPCNVILTL